MCLGLRLCMLLICPGSARRGTLASNSGILTIGSFAKQSLIFVLRPKQTLVDEKPTHRRQLKPTTAEPEFFSGRADHAKLAKRV